MKGSLEGYRPLWMLVQHLVALLPSDDVGYEPMSRRQTPLSAPSTVSSFTEGVVL
jgi:hypothetical protein